MNELLLKIEIPSCVNRLISLLEEAGYEAYIVGGCVRDALLGISPHDYDMTTSALISEMKEVFREEKTVLTGEKHGTLTVVTEGGPVEITTFRVDGAYADHRHPDTVQFTRSLSEDLFRRDYTVNAMAYSERTGLVDLSGGVSDLRNRILRTVGDPDRRFEEDALRILRGLRFAARFGLSVDEKTKAAMIAHRGELDFVSAERIYSELLGLLSVKDGKELCRILLDFRQILFQVIPELEPTDGNDQPNVFHCFDVYTHTAVACGASEADPELRFAMLFHDIGKPAAKGLMPDGRVHFHGHSEIGAVMAENVLRRLKAPNRMIRKVTLYVKYHEYFKDIFRKQDVTVPDAGFFLKQVGSVEDALRIVRIMRADTAGKSDFAREVTLPFIDKTEALIYNYQEENRCFSLRQLAVSGRDFTRGKSFDGKKVGEYLAAALDAVIGERIPNEKKAILQYIAENDRE